MPPSRLCDLLMGDNAACFFVEEMAGVAESAAAAAHMAGAGWQVASDELTVCGRYVDGKHALATKQPDGSLAGVAPTEEQVAATGQARDPFLREAALDKRVANMSLVEGGRLSIPPPPSNSKDIRVYGAACLESQENTTSTISTLEPDGVALSAAAKSTTAFDHADPTMPNYKLTPDITTSKLVLSRPHLRAASTKPVIASPPAVSMTPQGYPVYEGITVCR